MKEASRQQKEKEPQEYEKKLISFKQTEEFLKVQKVVKELSEDDMPATTIEKIYELAFLGYVQEPQSKTEGIELDPEDIKKKLKRACSSVNLLCLYEALGYVHACDADGKTALISAAETVSIKKERIQSLVDSNADVNAVDKDRRTALMYASRCGNVEVVKILLNASADVNAVDKYAQTALMYAMEQGRNDVVIQLGKYVAKDHPISHNPESTSCSVQINWQAIAIATATALTSGVWILISFQAATIITIATLAATGIAFIYSSMCKEYEGCNISNSELGEIY